MGYYWLPGLGAGLKLRYRKVEGIYIQVTERAEKEAAKNIFKKVYFYFQEAGFIFL